MCEVSWDHPLHACLWSPSLSLLVQGTRDDRPAMAVVCPESAKWLAALYALDTHPSSCRASSGCIVVRGKLTMHLAADHSRM